MSYRTRKWLRDFLRLGARSEKDGIPPADVKRQEDTVIRALDMLDRRPGIVLADEVGMGKTYEALGIAAAMRYEKSRRTKRRTRIVVLTPGPDLNTKWAGEFPRFKEMFDFGDDVHPVRKLDEFVQKIRRHSVIVAPVTMFQSGRGYREQTYLLSLFFYWKKLHGHTANAIMARFRDGDLDHIDVRTERFLGVFDLDQIEPYLGMAFQRGRSGGGAGLDDLYEDGGLTSFENSLAVRDALYRARFVLTGKLMPLIDLLIVDEAHKLKNPGSVRTEAMRRVFNRRFRKALFLTATPFQLDIAELREVFSLFKMAKGAPGGLEEQAEDLLNAVAEYQQRYETFQQSWSSLDPADASRFRCLYDGGSAATGASEEPSLKVIAGQVAELKSLKAEKIEPGFRRWMIRSLRKDKRDYREPERKGISVAGADALPFLIYERFIAELFRRRRQTHKAAAEINMVSSYTAAKKGSIISTADAIPSEADVYRKLLKEVLGEIETNTHEHPKISHVIKDALDAADLGEKTLIFCSRIATLGQLRRELDREWRSRILERWRRVYPGVSAGEIFGIKKGEEKHRREGRHERLQARFHSTQDALYLALREPYLRTLAPSAAVWALDHLPDIVNEANRILSDVRVRKTAAEQLNYQVARRCIGQAAIRLWKRDVRPRAAKLKPVQPLLKPEYVRFGFDLDWDEYEDDPVGNERPRWRISRRVVEMVIGTGGSLWETVAAVALNSSLDWSERTKQANLLGLLCPGLRVRLVEQLARYLTYREVSFIADLLAEARGTGISMAQIESAALLKYMPQFWRTDAGKNWIERLRTFLIYFLERDSNQQHEILKGPIKTIKFARDTQDGESRERLREAFNTPLYPMILIANEVMQEGLDLHKHCRRVVHHDLVWNPAQIEQRIGRLDRLGSLTDRRRKNGENATLDILYPLIRGTIDERLYYTVKTREKWLEFLLGTAPDFSEYTFSDENPQPLPARLSDDLAIDLSP